MAKHIVMYVDCSGSMAYIVEETHAACLTLLTKLQAMSEDIYISYFGFDSSLYFAYTRKKAKYLSSIPSPFASGGTLIYQSFVTSFNKLDIQQGDEVVFVIASDGGDYGGSTAEARQARDLYRKLQGSHGAQMYLVSLAHDDDEIQGVAKAFGVPKSNIAWGEKIEQSLTAFVHSVFQ